MSFSFVPSLSRYILRVVVVVASVSVVHAQQDQPQQPGLFESLGKLLQPRPEATTTETRNLAVAGKERRVALVIGNSAYPGVGALRNPANDANDIGAKLKKLGFDVTVRTDIRHKEMLRSLTEFGDKVQTGTEALFFYAGHGMQVRGKNYLIPIDAEIRNEASASSEAVDVDQLLDKLSLARLSVVILDACRNNPFERRFRGNGQGLAQINAPTGTLIAYATAPGKVAADGDGRNGLYTAELLSAMEIPGIKIEDVFKRVRGNVVKKSNDAQTPWESSSLTGDFYFVGGQLASLSPQIVGGRSREQIEDELWDAIKDGEKASVFEEYVKQYPNGRYLAQAQVKLAGLKETAKPTSSAKPAAVPSALTLAASARSDDPESDFWNEVKASGAREYFDAYLKQYPKGKYVALAKVELKRLDDKEKAERAKQDAERKAAQARDEAERKAAAERERQEQARLAKEAAEMRRGKVFKDCADCPEMVIIPSGSFTMGSPASETGRNDEEGPQHRVQVSSLAVGKFHVTRGQFATFVSATGYDAGGSCHIWTKDEFKDTAGRNWQNPGYSQGDNHPAVCVSWNDAKAYVAWISRKTGKNYRLLSEAEWEYAARAGTTTARYWGESPDQACAYANVGDQTTKSQLPGWKSEVHNCNDGHAYTSPVGSFKPNAFGLYDMIGNAYQWTEDCWNKSYNGAPGDGFAWTSGTCWMRVQRGGSWRIGPERARSALRNLDGTSVRDIYLGFRLARMLP